ncbi:efflux RND transporter periplasmic adaptor subunit [Rhodoferax ferrireducens]|uniref:efflux RND transporter periplasmic adaptor subunit n=1 Tax=Rhodoferax ferrireducens TaxID=192843 RepID=UPI000E0DD7FE|nr:efflux RND transporter periplasmic adaptor subunit [Rhodoferax ferrireducens]
MKNKLNTHRKLVIAVAVAVLLIALLAWRALTAEDSGTATQSSVSALTVNVVTAETQSWPQQLQASGALTAWQEIIVSPETGGLRIAQLLVDVGDSVRRGQLMAELADDTVRAELRKQEALAAQAGASLAQASTNRQRAQAVDVAGALAPQKMDEYLTNEATALASVASAKADVESARLKLAHTRIVAADDGVVSSKSAILGNVVNTGAELFRLVRQGRVEWRAELDSRQLAGVRAGQIVRLALPGGSNVAGKVRLVSPTLSTTTGRGIAYVSVASGEGAQPGLFASGTIELEAKPALTLPQSAVVLRDGRTYVYVVDSVNQVASRLVTTARRHGDRIEILSGLDGTARVVASGGAFLSEGAPVTVASVPTTAAQKVGAK